MAAPLTTAHAALLARIDLFASLDRLAFAKLAACAEPLTFDPAEIVCREGEPGDGLYVVVRGTFGIFATVVESANGQQGRIGSFGPGDVFGEMALLADEPRTATIRAETGGEVLRLERARFLRLLRGEPAIGLAIAATLGRRLRERDRRQLDDHAVTAHYVDQALQALPAERRQQLLEASVLLVPSVELLEVIFGSEGEPIAQALAGLSAESGPGSAPSAALGEVRAQFARSVGIAGVERIATQVAFRLLDAGHQQEALDVLDRHGLQAAYGLALARVLRGDATLAPEQLEHWIARLPDDEAVVDPDLALARAAFQERRGEQSRASDVLRRALARGGSGAQTLRAELARLESAHPVTAGARRQWTTWLALGAACGFTGLVALGRFAELAGVAGPNGPAVLAGLGGSAGPARLAALGTPMWSFSLLLAAAVVLWVSDVWPPSAVGLGLIAAWILSGTAQPDQAAAGFASLGWLFVLSVFGIAAAVARSGLLFRIGLMLVRRLPEGLFWQAGTLLLTGVLLGPVLPTSTGRAAITAPLALSVADARRLGDRKPAAAILGLAAWIGAGPLMFLFLSGSSTCLLAWGLLPEASRLHFDWITWTLAALPLAVVVSFGSLLMLFVVLRPEQTPPTPRGHVEVQLSVLGPPSHRELAMIVVLLLTVCGWIAGPALHVEVGVVAILGLLGAAVTGNLSREVIRELDWDYLIFYGVALSLARVGSDLGLDRLVGDAIGARVAGIDAGALALVLGVAGLSVLVRLVLGPDQAVLLLCLALVPAAAHLAINPWVLEVTVIAATCSWLVQSQTQNYLAAYSASEGRLFSPAQARRAALGYLVVLAAGLTLSVPYWHLLGLL